MMPAVCKSEVYLRHHLTPPGEAVGGEGTAKLRYHLQKTVFHRSGHAVQEFTWSLCCHGGPSLFTVFLHRRTTQNVYSRKLELTQDEKGIYLHLLVYCSFIPWFIIFLYSSKSPKSTSSNASPKCSSHQKLYSSDATLAAQTHPSHHSPKNSQSTNPPHKYHRKHEYQRAL